MRQIYVTCCWALLAVAVIVSSPLTARAAILSYQLGKRESYQQTSSAQPSSLASAAGLGDILFSAPTDIQSASITRPSSASFPIALSLTSSGQFSFTKTYATQAALDADFPLNTTFTYSIGGGTLGSKTATISLVSQDFYPSSIPFFIGTSFAQLQAVHANASLGLTFSGVSQIGGNITTSALVSINRVSDQANVFTQLFQNPSTTSTLVTVPANTLAPNTAYNVTVAVESFVPAQGSGFNAPAVLTFDRETSVVFTTLAVPEPSGLVLAVLGIAGLAAWGSRRVETLTRRTKSKVDFP